VLEAGAEAPEFTLKDQHGQLVTLSSLRRRNALLVFFPLAFTGICQGELDEIRDNPSRYDKADTQTLAISVGPPPTHKVWATQHGFTFPLLSDFWPHGDVAKLYGVFDSERGLATRGTFIIDKDGVVRWKVVNPIPQARDLAEYSKALAALG